MPTDSSPNGLDQIFINRIGEQFSELQEILIYCFSQNMKECLEQGHTVEQAHECSMRAIIGRRNEMKDKMVECAVSSARSMCFAILANIPQR